MAKLIATERHLTFPLSISVDNQASIQSGESFQSHPGSYLADRFRRIMQKTARQYNNFDVTICWVPGHSNVHGNEEADKHAKLAAENKDNNSPPARLPRYLRHGTLPLSISALKKAHREVTHARWERIWRKSPRYARMNQTDSKLLQRSFVKLTASFPKRLTSLYMFLRTGHAPLNKHLHHIGKAEDPFCPHCDQVEETVFHYLITCPQYRRERHALTCALGRKASSIPFLLTNPEATQYLVRFVNAGRRLKSILGEVPLYTNLAANNAIITVPPPRHYLYH